MKKIVVCLLIVFVTIALCSCSIFDTETDSESSIEGIVGKSVQIAFMDIYCTANSVSECQKDDDSYRLRINITADNKDEAQTFYASSFSLEDADGTTFVSNPLEIYVKSNETKSFNVYFDINRKMQRSNKDNEMNPNKEERLNDNQNQENQEDGIRRKRKRVTYKHRLQLRNSQVQQEQNLERTEDRESRRNSINFVNVIKHSILIYMKQSI